MWDFLYRKQCANLIAVTIETACVPTGVYGTIYENMPMTNDAFYKILLLKNCVTENNLL